MQFDSNCAIFVLRTILNTFEKNLEIRKKVLRKIYIYQKFIKVNIPWRK